MSAKHYVDGAGRYLGGFAGGAPPPAGSIQAPSAPPSADHTLVAGDWVAPPITPEMVDAEAQRRILAIFPEWKQREFGFLASVLAEKGRDNWNDNDLAAWNAGEALWEQIKPIRDASNALEATEGGIPQDYTDDGYWP
jgi:hypothetical protein